jgi:phosphoglucosamine mutase
MANLGFKIAMQDAGITVSETAVGDRYVLEEMNAGGFVLGGEQSGHIVMTDLAATGDGVLTALHVLAIMAKTGHSLADLSSCVVKLPQVLVNVSGVDKDAVASSDAVTRAVEEAESALQGKGRVLLRPSGTEPVVRVMVEAPSVEEAQRLADSIADVVRMDLALG